MVAILDALEAKGLLQRRARDDDRRSRAVHLTEAGNALLGKAFEIAMAHEKWTCEPLSAAERDRLIGLLERIGEHLGLSPGAHSALRDNHEPPAS